MAEEKKVPFYKKSWFIILTLILFFPVGLILMWTFASWGKTPKFIVTGVVIFFLVIGATGEEYEPEETTETEEVEPGSEEVEEEPLTEETSEPDEEEQEEVREETEEAAPEEVEENDITTIVEDQNYVIDVELIEEDYTFGTDEDIEVFSPNGEEHYKIQMDHHGGIFGSDNLDRIEELTEDITDENAEYDYLVFEILRTDNDDGDRWVYTRLNQEQAEALLNEDEMDDETFEEVADFFVSGSDANIGFNEEAINYDDMTTEEMIEYAAENRFTGETKELTIDELESGVQVGIVIEKGTSWNESSAVNTMRRDIALFLGDIQDYDLTYNNVAITFEGTLIDQAGNESIDDILISEFSDAAIKEINPENIGIVSENIDSLSDTWWLHPAFHE